MGECKHLRVAAFFCLVFVMVFLTENVTAKAEAKLSKTSIRLFLGEEGKETYTLSVKGVSKEDRVTFSVKDEAVASVLEDGTITAKAPGKTTVICTIQKEDGTKTQKKAAVYVKDNIKSISLAMENVMPNALRKNTSYHILYTCKTHGGTNENTCNYIHYEVLSSKRKAAQNATVDEAGNFKAARNTSYFLCVYVFENSSKYQKWATDREKYASYVLAEDEISLTVTPKKYGTQTIEAGGFFVTLPKTYTVDIREKTKNRTCFAVHVKNAQQQDAVSNIQVIIDKISEPQSYELLSATMTSVYTKGMLEQNWKLAYNAKKASVRNLKTEKIESGSCEIMKISYELSLKNIVLEMKEAADIKISRMDIVNTIYTWYDGNYHISVTVTDALESLFPNISDATQAMVSQFSK